ncbi:hypothetical protein BXY82_2351 [Gelidibacter sediminis]|uniref:Uncharacterized protein n=1 Tax=Gelidibacter sediminis TaxID=1608710 RepID=A0A4R7PZ43_9FLAO|nr:hypothetical protein BXY82_2351 [Gelidibacter sediminis]
MIAKNTPFIYNTKWLINYLQSYIANLKYICHRNLQWIRLLLRYHHIILGGHFLDGK